MSQYEILPKDPEHIVLGGWDPPLQTYYLQVFHWVPGIDEIPFFWRGMADGEISFIEDYMQIAEEFAVISESAKQILHIDKITNNPNNCDNQRFLCEDLGGNNIESEVDIFVKRFEKFIQNMFNSIYKIEDYGNFVDIFFQNLDGNHGFSRVIKEDNIDFSQEIKDIKQIQLENQLGLIMVCKYGQFAAQDRLFAQLGSIALFDYEQFRQSAYYWWKVRRIIDEIMRLLEGLHYPYDYGFESRADLNNNQSEFLRLGKLLYEVGGVPAMQGSFKILLKIVSDVSLLRGIYRVWDKIAVWHS